MAETKAMPAEGISVRHVNVPPKQTWNYLKVNEVSLTMPAPARRGDVVERLPELFSRVETGVGQEAVAWVEAAAGDARFVQVRAGERRDAPIVVDVDASAGTVSDLGVLVRAGAEATVAVAVRGGGEGAHSASLVRVVVEDGATLHLVEVVAPEAGTCHLEGVGISAGADAHVDVRQYALGGSQVAMGLCVALDGAHARLDLSCRYAVAGQDLLDVNHAVRQRGRKTRSQLTTSGILADSAHKTMRETIDLVHGAKGATGNEVETVLVTGDGVVNKTLPVILCDEEDVQGNHGASIGSIGPDQLDYLAARGLSEEEAASLFARAVFDDAAIHAPEACSRSAALARARATLGDEVASDLEETLGGAGTAPTTTTEEAC